MTILSPQDYPEWDSFVQRHTGSFLQTSGWPAEKFFVVAGRDDHGKMIGGCRVEERALWMGKAAWFVRRMPVEISEPRAKSQTFLEDIFHYLVEKAKQLGNVVMIRIQTQNDRFQITNKFQSPNVKIIKPSFLFHAEDPKTTLMIDLLCSEDELRNEMHTKTRYNIRLAEKKGVVVRECLLDEFYELYGATNRRKGLKGYPKKYFENILKCQAAGCNQRVVAAYHNDVPLASNLLVCFGDTATYLFGGTSDEHRELMAPHLLHWECMKWAKANGYRWYDVWGINAPGERFRSSGGGLLGHDTKIARDWDGITRFKKGFASGKTGKVVEYGETVDVVMNTFWYSLLSNIKRFL